MLFCCGEHVKGCRKGDRRITRCNGKSNGSPEGRQSPNRRRTHGTQMGEMEETRGGVATVIAIGLAACAIIAGPPHDLVAKNDHVALAAWYDKEAAHLRQHAKDMMVMAEEYEKNPGPSTRGVISPKIDFLEHCRTLAAIYTKAAEEADLLAQGHREMVK